jgi:hypothetical protein
MIYCACGDSGFKGRDPASTGGCDFTQRTIACPTLTSERYLISRFSVSTVSERGSSAMSGPGTAGGAGVATVGVGNDAALGGAAPTASPRVPGGACEVGPGGGGDGEAAALTSGE